MARRHERTHSIRRLLSGTGSSGSTLPCCTPHYTNDIPRPSSSGVQLALFADDTALFYESRNRSPIHPPPLRGPLTKLGQWFEWRIK
ncbi:hypothetical protein EVAR_87699_1 [Eumeta japonica]|uniref:Reverse transcriptase domain-containing protein n=1 Tax=Eumeta variegata TaxID=151549 RepID=A0A4C2ABM3_EUMVA|nr:hypothetical protein EVAR_87699_1 [Eumeta japonica]